MNSDSLSIDQALQILKKDNLLFAEIFRDGSISVEFYRPDRQDNQTPHDRDEIYIIATGSGSFLNGEKRISFKPGDFLFVPAGVVHRFEQFTDDFSTWVIFFGPVKA